MCWKGRKIRDSDSQGQGHWQAPRGRRKHEGVDVEFTPGEEVVSVVSGVVTKIGWPYADPNKSNLRYVEVTNMGYRYRLMYVDPLVQVGDKVSTTSVVGKSQDLGVYYKGITEHVHVEVWNIGGHRIDPTPLVHSLVSEDYVPYVV
jgi:murein DD-endopeptidase MepM/ murein hydrolase activator NlpD